MNANNTSEPGGTPADKVDSAGSLPALVRLVPPPWTFDAFEHRLPKYRTATTYAADSTRVCMTTGEHAASLAQLIVDAVNQYQPNAAVRDRQA